MKFSTFKRGVHPHDYKEFTNNLVSRAIPPVADAEYFFPLAQHIGAPCEPIVAVGDRVLLGQKIAEGPGFMTTTIHSSVSGEVVAIKEVLLSSGSMVKSIVIKNDDLDEKVPGYGEYTEYTKLSKEEITSKIKDNGIVGLGGASFPTHVKLSPPADKKIDFLIVNAAECEPFLTTDHRVMLEKTEKFIGGIKVVLHMFPDTKCIIGIETNKMDAIKVLQEATKNEDRIEVMGLVPKYPQGSEKQLIEACTGRQVPSGKLPSDAGAIVHNVDTLIAIYEAVAFNMPLTQRVVTISGDMAVEPGNYVVRLGAPLNRVLSFIGGFNENTYKVVSGGPMMGTAMMSIEVPLTKTSSAFLFLSEEFAKMAPERNCIRCAKCVDHCPIGLMPYELNYNSINVDYGAFDANNGIDCIECGCCSYICPSKRHLAQTIRATKRTVMNNKRAEAAKAAQAQTQAK